jgi:hypothetical protein
MEALGKGVTAIYCVIVPSEEAMRKGLKLSEYMSEIFEDFRLYRVCFM